MNACCQGVAAAAEFDGDLADVEFAGLGAHGNADFAIDQLFEEYRQLNSANGSDDVDEALAVFGQQREIDAGLIAKFPVSEKSVYGYFKGVEQSPHELDAAERIVVVDQRIDRADVQSAVDQIGRHFVGLGGGGRVLKRAGIGGNGDVDGIPGFCRKREIKRGDELIEDLSGCGAGGVDEVQIAVFRVGNVVVDVQPEFGFGSGVKRAVAESGFGGGIEGDGHFHIERL